MNTSRIASVWLVFTLSATAPLLAADGRYVGVLSDGTRVSAAELANWQDPAQPPSLAGKPLFDAANPFRWVMDVTQPPPDVPAAYVEFFGGDRCPGEVLFARDGAEARVDRVAPHLVVKAMASLGPSDTADHDLIRVTTEWIQRVVWHGTGGREYRPGTAFLRDGRELPFRTVRWSSTSVTLLLDEGIRTLSFDDLSELHMPRRDAWSSWFEPLGLLIPDGTGRLIQWETSDGLRATASTERYRPQFRGDRNKPESWLHVLQPAWSLDLIWVRFRSIRSWRFAAAHQVSLTHFTPVRTSQESYFAASVRWRPDRTVQGSALDVASNVFPAGFGVQARNELSFELHPAVRSFRTAYGLNVAAGEGGCAKVAVILETDQRRTLHQSEILVGSKAVKETGPLPISVTAGQTARIVLSADPVLEGRPAGSDPFDVRDFVDWLQPELELDPALVRTEIRIRAFGRVAALQGWSLTSQNPEQVRVFNHWDESNPRDPQYRVLLSTEGPFLIASSRLKVEKEHRWLAVSVTRPPTRTEPVRVQVRIDGMAAGEFEVAARASPLAPDPILFPLDGHQGRTVSVELVQWSSKPEGAVDWRGVAAMERRPGLLRLFDDEAGFANDLADGEGTATLSEEKPYRGKASLRVTAPGRSNPRLPGVAAAIREYPDFGEYRYIRFAWKMTGGSQVALSLGHDGQLGGQDPRGKARLRPRERIADPRSRLSMGSDFRGLAVGYRYDAGKGPPLSGPAIRLGGPVPDWSEVTRDLYADFGNFTLTGMQFGCPDGDATWFDQIYLGRTIQDFDSLKPLGETTERPAEADPRVRLRPLNAAEAASVLASVAPPFTTQLPPGQILGYHEWRGRKLVVRTDPPDAKNAFVMRTAVAVPAGKSARLELGVSQDQEQEWQLVVLANGQTIHETMVHPPTVKQGWLDLSVDLTKFAGQNVLLQVEQRATKNMAAPAFWSKAAMVTQ